MDNNSKLPMNISNKHTTINIVNWDRNFFLALTSVLPKHCKLSANYYMCACTCFSILTAISVLYSHNFSWTFRIITSLQSLHLEMFSNKQHLFCIDKLKPLEFSLKLECYFEILVYHSIKQSHKHFLSIYLQEMLPVISETSKHFQQTKRQHKSWKTRTLMFISSIYV